MNMKRIILATLALLLMISFVSFTACGAPDEEETTPALTKTQGQPAGTTAQNTQQPSGGSESWGDIPIYPGSEKIFNITGDENEILNDKPAVMEHRTYNTNGKLNDVADFYKDKMPANGWNETMWAELGEAGYIGQYEKNGGDRIVVLGLALNTQNNGTVYNIDYKYVK
jgi:hypothetical protein